ncbi:unnamed protein product, partial [Scytosiphon promiscuus]
SVRPLSGPIPSELGHLSALKKLYLSHHQLSGESVVLRLERRVNVYLLPAWFLSHFRGPIPPELGNLAALQYLHLQDNKLGGELWSAT